MVRKTVILILETKIKLRHVKELEDTFTFAKEQSRMDITEINRINSP